MFYIVLHCFTYFLQTAAIFRQEAETILLQRTCLEIFDHDVAGFQQPLHDLLQRNVGKMLGKHGTTWNEILDVKSWVKRRSAWVSKLIKMLSFSETLIFQDEIARSSRSKIMAFIQASLLALRLGIVQRHRAFVPVLRGKVGRHRRLTMEVTELGRGLSQHLESPKIPVVSTCSPHVIHM